MELVQTGGFTGLTRSASLRLSDLGPEEAARTAAALRTFRGEESSGREPAAPTQPRYELTIHDGSDVRTIVLHQAHVPTALQPLLHALLEAT